LGQPALGEQIGHLSDRSQAEPVGGEWERGHAFGITELDDRSASWADPRARPGRRQWLPSGPS
jgi:hypothetical protein